MAKRPIQRFVIEFPGPTPRESEAVAAWEFQAALRFAMRAMRYSGELVDTEAIYYAKLEKLTVTTIE